MLTPMTSEYPLRNRVKELRERIGLRQADLADAVGITRQTIIAIEKGRLNPSILISLKVARMLREPVDYVFYLAPGVDVLSLANVSLEAASDTTPVRKVRKGRPKGVRKPQAQVPAIEPESEEEEVVEPDDDTGVEVTGAESLEVIPDAEVLAPEPSEDVPAPAYEPIDDSDGHVDDMRYELDRDSDAATEEPQDFDGDMAGVDGSQEREPEPVPVEQAADAEPFSAPVPDAEELDQQAQVRETKSGQAIWDFF